MILNVRYAKILSMKKMGKFILLTIFTVSTILSLSSCGKRETIYYNAAFTYLENNQPEEAVENFINSIELEGEYKDTLRGLGIAYISIGQYQEAEDAFIRALNKSHGSIHSIDYDINDYLGYAYEMNKEYDKAIEIYSALITLHPKDTDAYYRRAICYLKNGEMSSADADFNVVTSRDQNNYDLHIRIYFSMKEAGFSTEAAAYLNAILMDEKRKISDFDRGRICYYLEDYSNARVYLEKAKDFSNPETILMLGKTYEAISDFSYAATLYSSYLDAKGNNAAVYNQLGVCRWKLGDYEGALSAFSFGLKLEDPEWKRELLFNQAVTYEYSLDFETAKERMAEYLKLYPKDEVAIHEALFLQTR